MGKRMSAPFSLLAPGPRALHSWEAFLKHPKRTWSVLECWFWQEVPGQGYVESLLPAVGNSQMQAEDWVLVKSDVYLRHAESLKEKSVCPSFMINNI